LQAEEVDETIDTIDWNMELAALRLLEGQYQSLSDAKIYSDFGSLYEDSPIHAY